MFIARRRCAITPHMRLFCLFPAAVLASSLCLSCSDDVPPPARAFVITNVGPGDIEGVNKATECKLTNEQWLSLGTSTTAVENGSQQSGAGVGVTCTVSQSGDGFVVNASATLQTKGSFTVTGTLKPRSAGAQSQKLSGSFTRGDTGTFRQGDCDVTFTGDLQDVGSGKVWASMTCPKAAFSGGQDRTCQGTAEFRFENCDK